MDTFTIGELASRSGFPASALRYYERIGLLDPPDRTAAGYRLYDEESLGRLAFIARAKQVGCTLEEIAELLELWEAEPCGPVQHRLHELVASKTVEVHRRIADLTGFASQLRRAAAHLSAEPVDGRCSDECACLTEPATGEGQVVDAPVACTLGAGDLARRMDDWRSMLAHERARHRLPDGSLRIELDDAVAPAELAALAAAEQACCRFFSFALTVDGRGLGLEVRAPAGAADAVDAVFGRTDEARRTAVRDDGHAGTMVVSRTS